MSGREVLREPFGGSVACVAGDVGDHGRAAVSSHDDVAVLRADEAIAVEIWSAVMYIAAFKWSPFVVESRISVAPSQKSPFVFSTSKYR